jgi:hypothetical protein
MDLMLSGAKFLPTIPRKLGAKMIILSTHGDMINDIYYFGASNVVSLLAS